MADPHQALATQIAERHTQAAVAAGEALPVEYARERINTIQKVLKGVMRRDTHYGQIPGTQKPTLYKPGAEVICTTFQLGVDPTEVEDLGTTDCIRYRVRVKLFSQIDGRLVGTGIGECSSDEEKYRWRKAVNEAEWTDTDEARRRKKHGSGRNGDYIIRQVRTNPADVANTILKMAKKRALLDAVLTATACSDMFTQDIEDLPEELRTAGLDAHDHAAYTPEEPAHGTQAVKGRVEKSRSGGAPDPDDDGDGEQRSEDEVAAMLDEASDVDELNYVIGLIKTVPDTDARARLRKASTKAGQRLAEGSTS